MSIFPAPNPADRVKWTQRGIDYRTFIYDNGLKERTVYKNFEVHPTPGPHSTGEKFCHVCMWSSMTPNRTRRRLRKKGLLP